MKFIADFHLHSKYSRATSKTLIPQYVEYWSRIKGITVVGTGDFTHPTWSEQLKEQLEPTEEGLFKLKQEYKQNKDLETPFLPHKEVRFILTTEISNIYKKDGKVRKVHNVIFAPNFQTVDKIQQKLVAIGGNITSDGRPILGLDSRNLLELCLEASENIFFVPAHIWTPWFSALGSKSGFDSITHCFGDLSHHIHAVETGLSTDPPMNWMCSSLDHYTLLSNSDAHSPEKLGRNANRFNTELSYDAIIDAMKKGDPERFLGTIDMFPQEGKYHYDGHRKCGVCWDPVETMKHEGICSSCGKPVTIGVMNRVVQLSDRENLSERKNRLPFQSIIPLKELLSELENVGPNSKKIHHIYMELIKKGVTELELLLDKEPNEIKTIGGGALTESIRRMRNREIRVQEGFDGEYGVIKVLGENETPRADDENPLFENLTAQPDQAPERRSLLDFDLEEFRQLQLIAAEKKMTTAAEGNKKRNENGNGTHGLNPPQLAAVEHFEGPALVIAGPGTGKTRVLTYRIKHLIETKNIDPGSILAVTFTNKAAAEIEERLTALLRDMGTVSKPLVTTFHGLGYAILKEQMQGVGDGLAILDSEDKKLVVKRVSKIEGNPAAGAVNAIGEAKQLLKKPEEMEDKELAAVFEAYERFLREQNLVDLEDLVTRPVRLLEADAEVARFYREKFRWVLVDEYQDINLAQYRLIRALMPRSDANLCVIGDPDQAIYGFRGADVKYIRQFTQDYHGAALYRLKQSYRCSDSILKASGDVMGRGGSEDKLLTGVGEGVKIRMVKNSTHRSEAEFVARTIEEMMGGLRFFSMDSSITQGNKEKEIESLSDFVVLCRVKGQMEALEKAFTDHSIPFRTIGEEPFFKQEPVCWIIDLVKLALNPGHVILKEKLVAKDIIKESWPEGVELSQLAGRGMLVTAVIERVVKRYFGRLEDGDERLVKRLRDMALEFGSDLEGFLRFVVLGRGVDTYRRELESVTLMTLHAAKGLEFKAVFIVGCEEGLLPYSLFKGRVSDREEERRLLYVGMTRAERFLFLCHAGKRFLGGREYELNRSSFLDSIERKLIQLSQQEIKKKEDLPVQRTLFEI
ncbi:MAG: UvrD-helicase domain-containing protein [bacterium]|nr:UvrD-helicase domain-containing protein [bacterium]